MFFWIFSNFFYLCSNYWHLGGNRLLLLPKNAQKKRCQKIWAGPPPLIWTKSKRTTVFFGMSSLSAISALGAPNAINLPFARLQRWCAHNRFVHCGGWSATRVGICDTLILLIALSREPHLHSLKYVLKCILKYILAFWSRNMRYPDMINGRQQRTTSSISEMYS